MAAREFVNIEGINGFEAWLKSVADDYLKLASFQRLAVLFRLVKLCSPSELYEYSNYVTALLRRDFVSLLPAELVDRLLSYVDYKSLLRACCVSIVHTTTTSLQLLPTPLLLILLSPPPHHCHLGIGMTMKRWA